MKKLFVATILALIAIGIVLGVYTYAHAQTTPAPNGWAFVSASTAAGCAANPTTIGTLCAVVGDKAYVSVSGGSFNPIVTGPVLQMAPAIPVGDLLLNGGGGTLIDGGKPTPVTSLTSVVCPTASLANAGFTGSACTIK